jgi:hypothetical protein
MLADMAEDEFTYVVDMYYDDTKYEYDFMTMSIEFFINHYLMRYNLIYATKYHIL